VDDGHRALPSVVGVQLDVIAHAVGGKESEDGVGAEQPLANDALQ
jgi:hypothetical protein